MKLKKILKILLGVIGALLLLLVLTFLFWLGPTVKLVAQTIGPKALGTDVHIDRLSINPIKGLIRLSDFSIKNPDVFGQTNAVSLSSLDISVDMASLFSPTIVVHQVEINSPYFIYEQDLQSDNITEFIRNVQSFANIDPSAPPEPKKEKKKKEKSDKPPKIVVVEQLAINDVQIHLANTFDDKLDMGIGLDSLTVSMTNGHTRLDNFYVMNPGRLESPHLFTLDGIDIQMEPGSIYSTNIHFNSIEILNPHAFIEHNRETDTVGEFLKIVNSLAVKIPTNSPKANATNTVELPETDPEPKAPPPTVTLESFIINDVQIHAVNIDEPELDIHLGMSYLSVALERGDIRMENLQLSNPAHFASPDIFSLDEFTIQLAPGSHTEKTVILEDIQAIRPHVYLELNTNFNTISEFLRIANGYLERIPTYEIPSFPEPPEAEDNMVEMVTTNAPSAAPFELYNLFVDDMEIYLLDTTAPNNPFPQPSMLFGIDDISVKLFQGKVSIDNIRIPNPEGFNATNLFHLAQIAVDIDPSTLHSDQVVINKIFVDSPLVDLEQTETIGNVAHLQTTLMQFAPTPEQLPKLPEPSSTTTPVAHPDAPATNAPTSFAEQPIVLNQLLLTNLAINLTFPVVTNETGGVMSSIGMENISLGKLKPMRSGVPEEQVAPHVPMTILAFDSLSLEPLKGLLYIDGLKVSNPPGFSRKDLVQLEHFRIDIDPDSIQSDTIHIEDILIQKPRIRYERQISTDNIKALQAEIEMATVRRQKTLNTAPETNSVQQVETNAVAEAQDTEESGQKVIIDRILIPEGLVQAKLSALPPIPVPLPTIEINDLGKEEGGASLAEANSTIFNTLYDSIIGAVGNTTGFATDALKGIGSLTFDTLGNAVDSVSDGVGNVTRGTKEAVEETVDKVKSRRSSKRRAGGSRNTRH